MTKILAVLISLFFITPLSQAANKGRKGAKSKCDRVMSGETGTETTAEAQSGEVGRSKGRAEKTKQHAPYIIIPSGYDGEMARKFQEFADLINEPGGVIDQLGIPRSTQVVEFMRGTDLNASIAGTAAKPIPHYIDGSQILKAIRNPQGLVFEVVYPGPEIQHGYYRDDNPFEQQLSIIMHVVGHNHFAQSSFFEHYRAGHAVKASEELAELLNHLYEKHDKDEVQRFYLYMQSLVGLQDFHTGYYQEPHEFQAKSLMDHEPEAYERAVQMGKKVPMMHPRSPTENVLQAYIENFPSHAPPWKKQIAELMRIIAAYQPALVRTQIMNEGWASLMQELIIKHVPEYNTFEHWLSAENVMQKESRPNLKDPYSLGVSAWRHLREKFRQQPEIMAMDTEMEKDRAFVKYADEIIGSMDDFQFLKLALDASWIVKNNFALVRQYDENIDGPLAIPPKPHTDQPVVPYVITSRDAEKVADAIIRTVVYGKTKFRPRVQLNDFYGGGRGYIELRIDDAIGNQLSMDVKTLAPTLFSMAQIMSRKTSMEAMVFNDEFRPHINNWEELWAYIDSIGGEAPAWVDEWDHMGQQFPIQGNNEPELMRVRTEVSVNGEVKVFRIQQTEKGREEIELREGHELFENIRGYLHAYIDDLFLEDEGALAELIASNSELHKFSVKMVNGMINEAPIDTLHDHAPTVAHAMIEYQTMLNRRLMIAMERARSGQGGLKKVGKKLYLKALPSVVRFQFDEEFLRQKFNEADKEVMDIRFANQGLQKLDPSQQVLNVSSLSPVDSSQGGNGQIVPIDGDVGGVTWGPDPSGGPGQGDGENPGNDPGEESSDPSWVEIPENLHKNFIGEKVKLPRLNPKAGKTKSSRNVLKGRRNQRHGVLRATDTAKNIIKKGMAMKLAMGEDPFEDIYSTMEVGVTGMRPRDWVVKDAIPEPKPDINAVVTFVMDGSGSTWGWYETYKRFVADMQAVLEYNYKNVEFRYITFDTKAYIMKDETEFFKSKLGGGTNYSVGIQKATDLHKAEYPRAKWDRYTFVLGDLGDWVSSDLDQAIKESMDEVEYMGVFRGGWGVDDLVNYIRQKAQDEDYFGYTDIGESTEYTIDHLRELLKDHREE